MRIVLAFELTKRDGKFQSRENIVPDFELVVDPVEYFYDDTAYDVEVTEVTEGVALGAREKRFLGRILRGERAANASPRVRKDIDRLLGKLGEAELPEIEVTDEHSS